MTSICKRAFLVLIVLLSLNACAYTPQKALITPNLQIAETNIGSSKEVGLSVVDERDDKVIGHRGSVYGKAAQITTEQDVPDIFDEKIKEGLIKLGFSPISYSEDFPRSLKVEIRLLEYSTSLGFWTGGIHMKSTLKALATNNGEKYEHIYRVNNEKRVLVVPTASKNEQIINQTASDVLLELFQDQELFQFLAH